jgi:hypothetical protein
VWKEDEDINMDHEAEFTCEGKIEESGGKKIAKINFPPHFQGHTFAVDIGQPGRVRHAIGPYRIEFVLGSEFLLYRFDLETIDLEKGYSNLELGESITKLESISLHYINTESGEEKDASLTLKTDGTYIKRFVVGMPEDKIDVALRFSEQILYSILDVLSFQKRVPIQIRQIEIFHEPSGDLIRKYITVPYTVNKRIEENDFILAQKVPESMRSILRLYREAINSSNPYHRFLCLYRIREGLQKMQARNSEKIKTEGSMPKRTQLIVPDNDLTKKYFPTYVGKKVNNFLDYVRNEFRDVIAHFEFNDRGRLILDPGEVRSVHRIDCANVVVEEIMRQSIIDELNLMGKHNLG